MPSAHSEVGAVIDEPLLDWVGKLQDLLNLKEGWNGYAAPVPTKDAVENACRYVRSMNESQISVHRVEASVMGGVGITHRAENKKIYVEFYNNGTVHVLFSERPLKLQTKALNLADFHTFPLEIKSFLYG